MGDRKPMLMKHFTFKHDGHALNYAVAGSTDAPPVLLIHGYNSSHHVWRTTIPVLKEEMYCAVIDLLGHGNSPIDPGGDYSIVAQGRRVVALADELGLDHFSLVGHSMGGQIALCIASILAPERVQKLVSVSGVVAAKLTEHIEQTVFRPIRLVYGTPFAYLAELYNRTMSQRFQWAAKSQFSSWFYDFDCVAFDWWRIDREMVNQPGMRHTWYHGMNAIKGLDLTDHLASIKAPTLVIFGKQDKVVPISDGHLTSKLVPDCQILLIDQCGHFPMYEKQDVYIKTVRDFLTG